MNVVTTFGIPHRGISTPSITLLHVASMSRMQFKTAFLDFMLKCAEIEKKKAHCYLFYGHCRSVYILCLELLHRGNLEWKVISFLKLH